MSNRELMRKRRQQRAQRRQLTIIGIIVVAAVAITAWLAWQNLKPIGEIVAVTPEAWPNAQGKSLGPADAPNQIIVFSDFQCPFCGQLARTTEQQVIEQFVATGQARLEYRHYIVVDTNVGGRESRDAAEASECAAEQGRFWDFHQIVFANQQGEGRGAFSERRLKAMAETIGLDTTQFNQCFASGRHADAVRADEASAQQFGINSTPTVFVNGVLLPNPLDFNAYARALGQPAP
jgi:protein-disulfide isomerase